MFTSLFSKPQPLLDKTSKAWIHDCFEWAKSNFDEDFFYKSSQLILPNNEFYPGRVASVHEMAHAIFDNTIKYAGLKNWPVIFVEPQNYQPTPLPSLQFNNHLRGDLATPVCNDFSQQGLGSIVISYNPAQINQPQDLIATLAQNFAMALIQQQKVLPPGGKKYMSQAVDFLACFLGFGVIMANTAYQFKGGCGSCNNASANRQSSLSEHETLYALALFCHHKKLRIKDTLPHLKTHLRKSAKQAARDVTDNN